MTPYLPDIMQGVVQRVSDAFAARATDPFNVFFEKGIYNQVTQSVYRASEVRYPLVWLIMPYSTRRGEPGIFGEVTCTLIIANPTSVEYTQQEREDLNFKPRLLPVYEVLLEEINREKWLMTSGVGKIQHNQVIRPFWGLGDAQGPSQENMFGRNVDAISVANLVLKVRSHSCGAGDYSINRNTAYPPIVTGKYKFYPDIELVVDGGAATDPVSGSNSVVVPLLLGKEYDVIQRGFGQLRSERSVEVSKNLVQGGFSLVSGEFNPGDSYFIKIQPVLIF
jgi:hypothetical protein